MERPYRKPPADAGARHAASERAARLRRSATAPERILWALLRDRAIGGMKFRRQHPLGPYVADFYCAEIGLVVELDGSTHGERRGADAERDRWMSERGLRVLRISASDFGRDWEACVEAIARVGAELKKRKGKEERGGREDG